MKPKLRRVRSANEARPRKTVLFLPLGGKRGDAKERATPMQMHMELGKMLEQVQNQNRREIQLWMMTMIGMVVWNPVIEIRMWKAGEMTRIHPTFRDDGSPSETLYLGAKMIHTPSSFW